MIAIKRLTIGSCLMLWAISASAADPYYSPDPGWYNQGSGLPRPDDPGSPMSYRSDEATRSSWYSSDWYSDQYRTPDQWQRDWREGAAWRSPAPTLAPAAGPASGATGAMDASPGYGAPARFRSDYGQDRDASAYGELGYGPPSPGQSQYQRWREPVADGNTFYRFRDDPALEAAEKPRDQGFRFRPLTERELEQHGQTFSGLQFAPRKERRGSGAEAFGSQERAGPFGYPPATSPAPLADDPYPWYQPRLP
ncbi:hypothetical protein [Thiohalocapsa marina]|nr:hypothetical protein [Thiohalocapsa marina]